VQAMCCGLESYGAPNTLTQKKYTTHAQTLTGTRSYSLAVHSM